MRGRTGYWIECKANGIRCRYVEYSEARALAKAHLLSIMEGCKVYVRLAGSHKETRVRVA